MSYVFIINDSFGEVELHPKLDLIEVKDFMGETHHNLYIGFDYYEDGAKLPYADFTVSFGEYIGMKNCAYVDTNNCRFADAILKTGIATDTNLTKQSGFWEYPLWIFKPEFLSDIGKEKYEIYSKEYDKYMSGIYPKEEIPDNDNGELFAEDLDAFFRNTADGYEEFYEDDAETKQHISDCIALGKFDEVRQMVYGVQKECYLDDDDINHFISRLDALEKDYGEKYVPNQKPSVKDKLKTHKDDIAKTTPTTQNNKKEMEL